MVQWYGYAAKMPAPKRASSPFCLSPTTLEVVEGEPLKLFCNARLNHEDSPHYAVGLVHDQRYLLAEWDDDE